MQDRIVVFSVDLELGWGLARARYLPSRDLVREVENPVKKIRPVLKLLEELDIPLTWAIVGAILLEPDGDVMFRLERDLGKCPRSVNDILVATRSREADSVWFSPEIGAEIMESGPPHELGCHSFSHVDFSAPDMTPEAAKDQMRLTKEVFAERGFPEPISFVFPWNHVEHLPVLRESGIRCYRSPAAHKGLARWGINLISSPARNLGEVELIEGISSIPGSIPLSWSVSSQFRTLMKCKLGLRSLKRNPGILHIYTHFYDMINERSRPTLGKILSSIKDLRKKEPIEILTMGELSKRKLYE